MLPNTVCPKLKTSLENRSKRYGPVGKCYADEKWEEHDNPWVIDISRSVTEICRAAV